MVALFHSGNNDFWLRRKHVGIASRMPGLVYISPIILNPAGAAVPKGAAALCLAGRAVFRSKNTPFRKWDWKFPARVIARGSRRCQPSASSPQCPRLPFQLRIRAPGSAKARQVTGGPFANSATKYPLAPGPVGPKLTVMGLRNGEDLSRRMRALVRPGARSPDKNRAGPRAFDCRRSYRFTISVALDIR